MHRQRKKRRVDQLRQALKNGNWEKIREAKKGEQFNVSVWECERGPDGEMVEKLLMRFKNHQRMTDREIDDLNLIAP